MLPVLTRDEMRAADAAALSNVSEDTLVARAGTAVGHAALRILRGGYGRHVTVIVGKGNNGADGACAAAFLSRRGARVTMVPAADTPPALSPADLVIDGAYGTGFRGAYERALVPAGVPVLSIDIPSGVDADTGEAPGAAFGASHTVTFAAYKPGLLQGAGPAHSGVVEVVDIGIPLATARAAMIEDADVVASLPPRPRQSNKWSTALGVASGSAGMEGSAILCTRGALAAGAGMIRLGTPGDPVGNWPTEAVRVSLARSPVGRPVPPGHREMQSHGRRAGTRHGDAVEEQIRAVIVAAPFPLVVDADGLTALGDLESARALLARRAHADHPHAARRRVRPRGRIAPGRRPAGGRP